MKFVTQSLDKLGARLGHISLENFWPTSVTTPFSLLYTRAGSVSHLTYDLLEMVTEKRLPFHCPLDILFTSCNSVTELKKGLAEFMGFQDSVIYMSVKDPLKNSPVGYNTASSVTLWGTTGRIKLDVSQYMSAMDSFKPTWLQALYDGDVNYESSRKRITKSVDRTLQFLDECLLQQKQLKHLKDSDIFGVIQGGYLKEERIRSTKETAMRPVSGFIIEGLQDGSLSHLVPFEETIEIVKDIIDLLPYDKPRILHGVWTPQEMLQFIEIGIDIFDTSYVHFVTEKGIALNFNYNFKCDSTPVPHKQENDSTSESDQTVGIDLNSKIYLEDFSAIMENCECYTCRKHSRSYIHHLLTTSEMLGYTLLMMHNLHHHLKFFNAVHKALKEEKFQLLKI